MKKNRKYTPLFWKMDCFFALHQGLCWGIAAICAVAGGLLILSCIPADINVYCFIALALLIAGGYYFLSRASERVMDECLERADSREAAEKILPLFLQVEKALPEMKKKEMAYAVTVRKGILLLRAGKRAESLALLKGFTKCWDEGQKEYLRQLIALIETRPDFEGFARKEEN